MAGSTEGPRSRGSIGKRKRADPLAGGPPRIEDYAIVGDLQTAALVSRGGSVDWCCFPRFDSGACFAALLGSPDHGRWLLVPTSRVVHSTRRYRHHTLILESILATADGSVRITEFMPPRDKAPNMIRIVEGLDGAVPIRSELVIRFDFGTIVPWVRRVGRRLIATAGPDALSLTTPVEIRGEGMRSVSEFTVHAGERIPFVLAWFPSQCEPPEPVDAEASLRETEEYWLDWAQRCGHEGEYHDEIHQSLLVLKALTYAPTGGLVAAPTTSLPELIGGVRNWDYRYCWLRDATLTLIVMLNSGYNDEAVTWRQWLLRAVAGNADDLQPMYGIAGERRLDERELEWLPGYEASLPVRIGNAASKQLQLDVYGEVLDALYQTRRHGAPADDDVWSLTLALLEWLEEGWREEDAGIWEVRGPNRHFTHSKVMAWVAFDRGVRYVEELGRAGPVRRWRELRDEIHAEVLAHAWSDRQQAFAQSYGSHDLDAAALLMPLVGFIPATDPRFCSTVDAIRRELTVDGLLLRYRSSDAGASDGLPPGEAVFLPCSFWLASALALQGKHAEARSLFQRLLDIRNDVGLVAEGYDPVSKRQLGNFPQALTHLALIGTALILSHGRPLRELGSRSRSTPRDGVCTALDSRDFVTREVMT